MSYTPLTNADIKRIYREETGSFIDDSPWALIDFSRAIEAATITSSSGGVFKNESQAQETQKTPAADACCANPIRPTAGRGRGGTLSWRHTPTKT